MAWLKRVLGHASSVTSRSYDTIMIKTRIGELPKEEPFAHKVLPLILERAISPRQRGSSRRARTPPPPSHGPGERKHTPGCSCSDRARQLSRAIHEMNALATRARPRCSGESAGPPLACFEVPAQAADQGAVWVYAIRWGFFLASVEAERQGLPREAATAIPAPVEAYVQQHFARWGIEASRKNLLRAGVGRREITEYFARDARAASNSRSRARAQPRQPPQRQG